MHFSCCRNNEWNTLILSRFSQLSTRLFVLSFSIRKSFRNNYTHKNQSQNINFPILSGWFSNFVFLFLLLYDVVTSSKINWSNNIYAIVFNNKCISLITAFDWMMVFWKKMNLYILLVTNLDIFHFCFTIFYYYNNWIYLYFWFFLSSNIVHKFS